MRFIMTASILCLLASPAMAHDLNSRATYLGNEGVMIERGDTKILFDAFYADSYGQYALVPDDIVEAMLNGEAPYDGVDAIFVSHVHGDHFSAEPAITYLRAQKDVTLYASVQIKAAFLDAGIAEDDPMLNRVKTFDLNPESDALSFSLEGLQVSAVSVPHAGSRPEIQNFVWRVTLDDATTVMHLGDAGTVTADFDRHADHFAEKDTNIAFPPYWFLSSAEGRTILETYIDADHTIGVHVPASAAGRGDELREQIGGDLFTDPGETRDISPLDK